MRFDILERAVNDKSILKVAQLAPAVRVSLGELFGFEAGTILTKKIVGALKELGFDYVFDTSFGADVAIVEESKELDERLKKGGIFPLINSCCPGTISFLEHSYPELVPNIATVKSPMEVTGVLIKTYFAGKKKIHPEKILSVAVMPCVIKKAEALRPELRMDGRLVVDGVLTTVELAELMKAKKIDLKKCKEMEFDSLLGVASGGGQIFGSTGGVSEAALRNYAYLNKVPIEKINTTQLRSFEGIREIEFSLNGQKIKIAIINSLRNANQVLNDPDKLKEYTFIEIMACLGGCVGGAGQPMSTKEILEKRRAGLYKIDSENKIKASSENPEVKRLYEEFLGSPRSRKAIRALHTGFARTCLDCF